MRTEGSATEHVQETGTHVDPLEVLREVLELQCESDPGLNVEGMISYAVSHPEAEIVDSLGAVSVVCVVYDAYTPKDFIPHHLLTHYNFTTLDGLRKVLKELHER